jgi:nitrite reductase/ring-hydroxylating ferredoxin subunit
MYQHGWYQIAFEHDLTADVTPLAFAQQRLMAVKQHNSVRLFAATCPHRGAHLAYGGTVDGDAIVCPFHGLRIQLGASAGAALCVREYPCLVAGGMVFIRLSDRDAPDLPQALAALHQHYTFIPGFAMPADVAFEIATENALDNLHFKSVHGILNEPEFTVDTGPYGELQATGDFVIPALGLAATPVHVQYHTAAFSPGVVISALRGAPPYNYVMISTATPALQRGTCIIRLTLALPPPVDQHLAQALCAASQDGLEKDRAIWQHLAVDHTPTWTPHDTSARAFAQFCHRFSASP